VENWQASCPFNLAHKLKIKKTEKVLNRNYEAVSLNYTLINHKSVKNAAEKWQDNFQNYERFGSVFIRSKTDFHFSATSQLQSRSRERHSLQ